MADDDTPIQKEPVHARDEAPSKLFGFTFGEMGMIAGYTILVTILFHRSFLTFGTFFALIGYVKYIKPGLNLPDNFFRNMIRFYIRKDVFYRAAGRDTEWSPPVLPVEKKN